VKLTFAAFRGAGVAVIARSDANFSAGDRLGRHIVATFDSPLIRLGGREIASYSFSFSLAVVGTIGLALIGRPVSIKFGELVVFDGAISTVEIGPNSIALQVTA